MNFSLQIKQGKNDEWKTPERYVYHVVPYLKAKGFSNILCPFDEEESAFVKVLSKSGFTVTRSHIKDGKDFFDVPLDPYDCIVSNPPFSKRDLIYDRLFSSGKPFAMIANSNGLFDNRKRFELFKQHNFELLIPKGRMKFIDEQGIEGSAPEFQSIWVCRDVLPKQIVFIQEE